MIMKAGPISASHAAHSPSKRQRWAHVSSYIHSGAFGMDETKLTYLAALCSRIQSLIDIRRNIKSGTSCPNCDSMQSIVALSLTRTQVCSRALTCQHDFCWDMHVFLTVTWILSQGPHAHRNARGTSAKQTKELV